MKRSGWMLGVLITMGGLLGAVLGEVLRAFTPEGPVQSIFLKSLALAIDPPLVLDVVFFKITMGAIFQINLLAILGMFLGLYLNKNL